MAAEKIKKHKSISDKEYNDILQWLKEEIGFNKIELSELSKREIIKMGDTFLYQRWRARKAYRKLAAAMRETRLGSILISIIERIDKIYEKLFCLRL